LGGLLFHQLTLDQKYPFFVIKLCVYSVIFSLGLTILRTSVTQPGNKINE